MILRPPNADELQSLSEMCLRSKSVWNYDDVMLDAFRSELTLTEEARRGRAGRDLCR